MSKTQKQDAQAKFRTLRRGILIGNMLSDVGFVIVAIIAYSVNKPIVTYVLIALSIFFPTAYGIMSSGNLTNTFRNLYKTMHELQLGHLNARCNISSRGFRGLILGELDSLAAYIKYNVIGVISKISDGDVSMNVELKDKDDMVTPELKKIISCMRSLSNDTERLITAVSNGNLKERGYTDSYKGSWKHLIESINTLIDKIVTPINEVMEVTRSLAANDYTHVVNNQYEGTFNELATNINEVRETLIAIQGAVVSVSMGDTGKLEEFQKTGKKSENDYMIPSIIKMMQTIRDLISEIKLLTSESLKGNITNIRGDTSKFEGGYKEIIDGVNNTLDTIVKPIRETTRVLDSIAVDDLTVIPDSSVMIGDFEHLGDSIKQVQSNVLMIQSIAAQISSGDISALEKLKVTGKQSENDQLIPAFTKMMESISSLMDETSALANAAIDGRLEYRSNTNKFEGEFANILNSFNSAFNNMAKPVKEISEVMEKIAAGDLSATVSGEYKGAFSKLSQVVNDTAGTLNSIFSKISFVLTNIADGNLDLEKVEAYQGNFTNISTGLNNIMIPSMNL